MKSFNLDPIETTIEIDASNVDWGALAQLLPDHPGLRDAAKDAAFRHDIRQYVQARWQQETGQGKGWVRLGQIRLGQIVAIEIHEAMRCSDG